MTTAFTNLQAIPIDSALPVQNTSTGGKALISNGTTAGWNTILSMIGSGAGQTPAKQVASAILPSQAGQTGKILSTDGSGNLSWVDDQSGSASVTGIVISGVSYTGNVTISHVPSATVANNVSGVIAVANGGTGATSAAQALTNLGAASSNHTHNYAPLASPAFSGVPTAPTAAVGTNTTQIATTAFVMGAVSATSATVGSMMTRSFGVTYTATTDGFITGSADNNFSVNSGFTISVNGSVRVYSRTSSEGANGYVTGSFLIAAGQTYSLNITGGASALSAWWVPLT